MVGRTPREADRIGTNLARMQCSVRRAVVYYKAGYIQEAIADLRDTFDGVLNIDEKGSDVNDLIVQIQSLLEKMEKGEDLSGSHD